MRNPVEVFVDKYRQEAYVYFDKNICELPRKESGEFNESGGGMQNNDADAFRHAYVSGVMTQIFSEPISEKMGLVVEWRGKNPENQKNMDLWNNSVGRKYGKQANTKEELADFLKQALENGELILSLDDLRKYEGKTSLQIDDEKPVVVLKENETGRNEVFLNLLKGEVMDREAFVSSIEGGEYSGYNIASINNIATPISKPDQVSSNNLG
ncbi:hypothetical protein HOH45_05085 [bacterium]|jgi:hypothetical protein|nr:hypothetical protein [bacterium]